MERQTRLRGIELVLQLADASFPIAKHLEDSQTSLVREGMKELRGTRKIDSGSGHGEIIHQDQLISQGASGRAGLAWH